MAKKENEAKNNNKQKRRFFKDMKAELKKVIWPSAKQTANNTIAVIGFTLAVAIIVFILDTIFQFGHTNGIVALQEKVKSSYSTTNSTENETAETDSTENTTNVEAEATTENATNSTTNATTENAEKTETNTTAENTSKDADTKNTESKK